MKQALENMKRRDLEKKDLTFTCDLLLNYGFDSPINIMPFIFYQ